MSASFKQSGIADGVVFAGDVTIVQPVNLYGCTIGRDCFIGPFTEIQKDVRIGQSCKIQSHTFICEFVEIGDHCFIGHGVMFVNDLFSEGGPAGDKTKWKPTRIGDHVSIGSNATILPVHPGPRMRRDGFIRPAPSQKADSAR